MRIVAVALDADRQRVTRRLRPTDGGWTGEALHAERGPGPLRRGIGLRAEAHRDARPAAVELGTHGEAGTESRTGQGQACPEGEHAEVRHCPTLLSIASKTRLAGYTSPPPPEALTQGAVGTGWAPA